MHLNGARVPVRRPTDVGTSVSHLTVLDDEHADEHLRLDLLGDQDATLHVGVDFNPVFKPLHVVRGVRLARGVTHQVNRGALLHVLCPRDLDRCGRGKENRLVSETGLVDWALPGGDLVSIMPECVCPKVKEMGSFSASSE